MDRADGQPLLRSAPNFRDLGGYRTMAGGNVRRGRIFRSEAIARPTEADLAVLRDIGIRLVCDARSADERDAAPSRWPDGQLPEILHLDIRMDLRSGPSQLIDIIASDPTANGVRRMMLTSYGLLPQAFAGRLGPLLQGLVDGKYPALIHCTAGKDRTGVLSAILLETLGVARETIYEDYARTDRHADMERMMAASANYVRRILGPGAEPDPAMLRVLCGTSPDFLDASFAAIDREYGSVERYLAETAGFGVAMRERLRAAMLE